MGDTVSDDIEEIGRLIHKVKVAMFTTRDAGGHLVSRPLQTRDMPFAGEVLFFTALDSKKVEEIEVEPQVNLAYANPGDGAYVSIDGRAEVIRDRATIDALWSETFDSLFFKGGKSDPNLVLLKVVAHSAEVWTSSSTAIGRAFDFLKAKATGDVHDLGEQKHVRLS